MEATAPSVLHKRLLPHLQNCISDLLKRCNAGVTYSCLLAVGMAVHLLAVGGPEGAQVVLPIHQDARKGVAKVEVQLYNLLVHRSVARHGDGRDVQGAKQALMTVLLRAIALVALFKPAGCGLQSKLRDPHAACFKRYVQHWPAWKVLS